MARAALRGMDGLIALLSLGVGVAAWWWVAKTLGAKGTGVVVRHLAGAAAWFFGTGLLLGMAQAAGLVESPPAEAETASSIGNPAKFSCLATQRKKMMRT